jgi:hypothetical protein
MSQPQIPYITRWSAERSEPAPIVASLGGIGYADETLGDRDSRGVLWARMPSRPGQGRPELGNIHSSRQRRAMRKLLCQVCAEPADTTADGVLWVLKDHRGDWAGWPNGMGVTEPPICLSCARLAARACPALRSGHIAVRVRAHAIAGVFGLRYRAGLVESGNGELVSFSESHIRWTLASQLVRELHDCTILS